MIQLGDHVGAVLASDLSNAEKVDALTDNLYRDYLRTWSTPDAPTVRIDTAKGNEHLIVVHIGPDIWTYLDADEARALGESLLKLAGELEARASSCRCLGGTQQAECCTAL